MDLEGKVAIVTGAGKGIGQGIAHCLADAGADVVINSFHDETAAKVADEVRERGRKSLAVAADVTTKKGVVKVVKETLNAFDKIDILVNNFGAHTEAFYTRRKPQFIDQDISEWDDDYNFNMKSQVLMALEVVPHFIEQGHGNIVNISSVAGRMTVPSQMPYGAMKAASIYFTRTLAQELAPKNIRVNCVCPGGTYSGMMERGLQAAIDKDPELKGMTPRQYYEKNIQPNIAKNAYTPLKQELTAEDSGHATVFLASDLSRSITGQSLTVDCGLVTY